MGDGPRRLGGKNSRCGAPAAGRRCWVSAAEAVLGLALAAEGGEADQEREGRSSQGERNTSQVAESTGRGHPYTDGAGGRRGERCPL